MSERGFLFCVKAEDQVPTYGVPRSDVSEGGLLVFRTTQMALLAPEVPPLYAGLAH